MIIIIEKYTLCYLNIFLLFLINYELHFYAMHKSNTNTNYLYEVL